MWESLRSEGIWTHSLCGGRRRDVENAGVDGDWRPDLTCGRCRVQSTGKRSERPQRLIHGTLWTHIIIFADAHPQGRKGSTTIQLYEISR